MASSAANACPAATPSPSASASAPVAPSSGRFMFVEYSAPAKTPPGQKKRRGGPTEVRAHVTKQWHRTERMKRLRALQGPDAHAALPDRTTALARPQPKPPCPTAASPSEEDSDEVADPETEVERKDSCCSSRSARSAPTSTTTAAASPKSTTTTARLLNVPRRLQSILGEGRVDPFDVLDISSVPGDPSFINKVIDHALECSWPRTVPASAKALVNPVKSAWLRMAMEHKVVLHAFIYATAFHLLCLHGGREFVDSAPLVRLFHKGETIKLVNERLSLARTGVELDALIMAVAILSVHGSHDPTVYPVIHPPSPMVEMQHLNVYGNMINDEKHIQGISLLINKMRGGLDRIELYGLADTLQLCDLYFASKYACRPKFPWRRPPLSLVGSGKHTLDTAAIELDSKLCRRFRYLRATPAGKALLEVLEAYAEVTTAIDQFVRGGLMAPDMVDIIEARNCTQHRLLAQIPQQLDLSDPLVCVHHAIRLGTMIFSDMVIFPVPPSQRVKPRLALLLQHTLEACDVLGCYEMHAQVMVWALTLGAIAASFTGQRSWYIDQLRQHCLRLNIQEWAVMESICAGFLWWNPVCGPPSKTVWKEMFLAPKIEDP